MLEECYECQLKNYEKILDSLKLKNKKKSEIFSEIVDLASEFKNDSNPLNLTHSIYNFLKKHSNIEEHFNVIKDKSNQVALNHLKYFGKEIKKSKDLFFEKMKYSILGNIIDYGIPGQSEIDFENEFNSLQNYEFGVNHYKDLLKDLEKSKNLLYFADNAGEIIFDIYFIEEVEKLFPDLKVFLVVRSGDIINDISINDIHKLGYDGEILDSGSFTPGIMTSNVSNEFLKLMKNADIIISKGQGNYEGLCCENEFNIYFLFVAKCQLVADEIGVDKGNLVVLKGY